MHVKTQRIPTRCQEQLFYHAGSQTLEQGPRDIVESLSLEIFEVGLENTTSNLIYLALL